MKKKYIKISLKRMFLSKNKNRKKVILFDSSLDTFNIGDHIIMSYCNKIMNQIFADKEKKHITFHGTPLDEDTKDLATYKYKFICGTNVLSPNVEWFCPFHTTQNLEQYNDICLLGVGWGKYSNQTSIESKEFYRCILSKHWLHSVRDRYTEKKCLEMGFKNVIFTACPTMWKLTPEFCKTIPHFKEEQVVFALTDYDKNEEMDRKMIQILRKNYRKLYFWAQGTGDVQYLSELGEKTEDIVIIDSLEQYTNLLKNQKIDFVGVRLHAGIHALNNQRRTIIIAIDNRAIEMEKDTKLPIVLRDEIENKLEKMINSSFETKIEIPTDNINKWKAQYGVSDGISRL